MKQPPRYPNMLSQNPNGTPQLGRRCHFDRFHGRGSGWNPRHVSFLTPDYPAHHPDMSRLSLSRRGFVIRRAFRPPARQHPSYFTPPVSCYSSHLDKPSISALDSVAPARTFKKLRADEMASSFPPDQSGPVVEWQAFASLASQDFS